MLNDNQLKFINNIPIDKKVTFQPYNPDIKIIADDIINKIKKVLPKANIKFMGASALGISGQNDIDIYILEKPAMYNKYAPLLEKAFGNRVANISLYEWTYIVNNHEVTIYLDDPAKESTLEQIKVFEILSNHHDLLKEYEDIKKEAAKLGMREYQRQKYEFYNNVLSNNDKISF